MHFLSQAVTKSKVFVCGNIKPSALPAVVFTYHAIVGTKSNSVLTNASACDVDPNVHLNQGRRDQTEAKNLGLKLCRIIK
jgi:hypothetical protein